MRIAASRKIALKKVLNPSIESRPRATLTGAPGVTAIIARAEAARAAMPSHDSQACRARGVSAVAASTRRADPASTSSGSR